MENTEQNAADKKEKLVTIIINGTEKEVDKGVYTFDQIIALAEGLPKGPNILYTITYRKAEAPKHEGTLVEGGTVTIKEGPIFNVTPSDKS
jgi:hypothetical protein